MKSPGFIWVGLTGLVWCVACASNPKGTGTSNNSQSGATSAGNTSGTTGTQQSSGTTGGTGTGNTSGTPLPGSGSTVGASGSGTSGAGATSGVASGGAISGGGSGTSSSGTGSTLPDGGVPWPSAACAAQTAALIKVMTRQEKAAQMVMSDLPSAGHITSTGNGVAFLAGGETPGGATVGTWAPAIDAVLGAVPAVAGMPTVKIPLLYGFDAVHGNNGTTGTVVFPHNAGMASSRNAGFVQMVGQIEAQEITAGGINWMFGPFAGTTWDYRWGRVYESFSEDPTWAGEMITALIQGLQGTGGLGSSTHLMACSKHAAADGQGGPPSGKGGVVDRGNSVLTVPLMEQYGLAPYVPALAAGLGCIMVSDGNWNGDYMTTSSQLITSLLKGTYGFKGFVITDYDSGCPPNAIPAALAGVDMFMATDCEASTISALATATATGLYPDRINDAVTRILNAKCQAGNSFTTTQTYTPDQTLIAAAGSAAHRKVGETAVAQSLVLLQNNNMVLPIAKTAKVFVGGSGANDIGQQCGGWTISWQGSNGNITTGTTIQQGIAATLMAGGGTVATAMADADVNVIVLSEKFTAHYNTQVKTTYAEFEGDSDSIDTLNPADIALLSQARASGKKVVALIVSGRPVLINSPNHPTTLTDADAWIAAWLPGTEGEGVADVLFGVYAPTGKLSHSFPPDDASANIMCGLAPGGYAQKNCIAEGGYKPLFALGAGCTGYTCP
jgi:beta-glucosidase